jgi:hypothetical protein
VLYCIYVFMNETREFSFSGTVCQIFFSQGALCLVRLLQFRLGFVRLVDSKRRNFVFIMLECKTHGVSQETRPMTCVLGLEGIALG